MKAEVQNSSYYYEKDDRYIEFMCMVSTLNIAPFKTSYCVLNATFSLKIQREYLELLQIFIH